MRKIIIVLISIVMISFIASCNDTGKDNDIRLTYTLERSSWRVTYFVKASSDEMGNIFRGYNFKFKSTNVVTAYDATTSIDGKWSAWSDGDGHSMLVIDFGIIPEFRNLNDDWQVLELTDTKVRMIDVNDVNDNGGGLDYLTFERN